MKKTSHTIGIMAFITISGLTSNAAQATNVSSDDSSSLPSQSCSITCYEKNPACYVSKDKDGCLTITNEKPKCSKDSCICTIKGCNKKTEY